MKKTEKIVIAGFGGQGVLFTGKVLCQAALEENKATTYFPSYGAEMRGGTAHCLVVISGEEIASPIFKESDSAIFLNEPSVKKFVPRMKKESLAVINSSLAKKVSLPEGIKAVWVPATEIARKIGEIRIANLVALGAFLGKNKIISLEAVKKALKAVLSGKKEKLLALNLEALQQGLDWTKG